MVFIVFNSCSSIFLPVPNVLLSIPSVISALCLEVGSLFSNFFVDFEHVGSVVYQICIIRTDGLRRASHMPLAALPVTE